MSFYSGLDSFEVASFHSLLKLLRRLRACPQAKTTVVPHRPLTEFGKPLRYCIEKVEIVPGVYMTTQDYLDDAINVFIKNGLAD